MADRFLECDDVEQVKETEGYEGLFHLIEQNPGHLFKSIWADLRGRGRELFLFKARQKH